MTSFDFFNSQRIGAEGIGVMKTNPRHMGPGSAAGETEKGGFASVLTNALNEVNNLEQESAAISQLAVTNPDDVDVHDVTIAMSKATTALGITKAVVDKALTAYRDITNIR